MDRLRDPHVVGAWMPSLGCGWWPRRPRSGSDHRSCHRCAYGSAAPSPPTSAFSAAASSAGFSTAAFSAAGFSAAGFVAGISSWLHCG
eukprot:s5363_g4.t1